LADVDAQAAEQVVYDIKYSGYVVRQQQQIARQQRLSHKRIPEDFDYTDIMHLRTEAREKLSRIQPVSIAQASRISGITPADVALVMAHLEGRAR
jgi:tRNA uridine 5-carboxymethylaminomethyl modification enzyme